MDKVFQGPAKSALAACARFSPGRAGSGGLVVCLWVWMSAAVWAASEKAPGNGASDSAYRDALASFQRGDDARALSQLEHVPSGGTPRARADILNLRGAIYLRQHRYEQAQADFTQASTLDHSLWAARFNEAEVSFRQKRYGESQRRFAALLDQTSRLLHNGEYRFVQYKSLLASTCAGDDKPALAFVADHRDDAQPPAAWYYLNAALERRHGNPQKAAGWLAQADARLGASAGRTYAESFERLGWGREPEAAAPGATHDAVLADAASAKAPATAPHPRAETGPGATVAVVQVMPEHGGGELRQPADALPARPHGRPAPSDDAPLPEADDTLPSVLDVPPGADDPAAAFAEILRTGRDAGPATLARPKKARSTPSPPPDASPDASPGVTANQGGGAAANGSPAASPSPEFTEKYEAAYVKFLEKNYPETLSLLDEADKIQAGQPQSISLRFKSHYALAYLAYRKQDYAGAVAELDQADQTQKNADAYNLRGLVFSKQHAYDQAEAMFHKAIVTDPGLWAAKFNYAELPFNRGDYTNARTRFEELFSQTDAAKQPREAELTQYKVFLTLLLEGRVEAASTFMDHLNFSGATPARYFCNAALNFRAGSVDRAKNWIDDAKKEYPPQLVAIFIESFYRLGWMADPNAPPGTMVAQTTPGGTPSVTTSGTQPTTVATATAAPSASPGATALAAMPTPFIVAAASPTPTPFPTPDLSKSSPALAAASPPRAPASASPAVAVATPTARPLASASPAVVLATPAATSSPARPLVAAASASPFPAASAPPAIVAATPAGSVVPGPRPSATAPVVTVVPAPSARPARSVALASATPTPAVERITPTPAPAVAANAEAERRAKTKRDAHIVVLVLVLGQAIFYLMAMRGVFLRRKQREMRAAARRRATVESSK